MKWVDNHIEVEATKKPKKITGTRFSKVLGKNVWGTDFEAWCDIVRVNPIEFEDNEATIAGKVIEPKIAEFLKKKYGMNLLSPTDVYGLDYFKKTWGDFFPENKIFGGMWDYLQTNSQGDIKAVLEFKTTKRSEDWLDGIPEYYSLQVALYCYLLGVDNAIVVTSILEDKDYKSPDDYIPTSTNTFVTSFKVSEKYPEFEELIKRSEAWWEKYVVTGVSPNYDLKKKIDKQIIDLLTTKNINPETDMDDVIKEAEILQMELADNQKIIAQKEKRLKELTQMIKDKAISEMGEDDKKVVIGGTKYVWTLSKVSQSSIDKDKLSADGLLEKYQVQKNN